MTVIFSIARIRNMTLRYNLIILSWQWPLSTYCRQTWRTVTSGFLYLAFKVPVASSNVSLFLLQIYIHHNRQKRLYGIQFGHADGRKPLSTLCEITPQFSQNFGTPNASLRYVQRTWPYFWQEKHTHGARTKYFILSFHQAATTISGKVSIKS